MLKQFYFFFLSLADEAILFLYLPMEKKSYFVNKSLHLLKQQKFQLTPVFDVIWDV